MTRHRIAVHFLRRMPAYTGRKAARSRLPSVALLQEFGDTRQPVCFTLLGPGNEEEWGMGTPTLIEFAEIVSLESPCENCKPRAGSFPTLLPSFKFSDKCHPSLLDGYYASSPRLLALSQLRDAGWTRFIGPTKRCVAVAQNTLLRLVLMLCTKDLWQGDGCHEDKRAGCAR